MPQNTPSAAVPGSSNTLFKEARDLRRARFLEASLSSLPDLIYAFDRQHRFAYANPAMLALFGLTSDEMQGKNFADLDYPTDLARLLDGHLDRVFKLATTVEDEVFFRDRTGKPHYFSYHWGPLFADDNSVEFVVGVSRDTTERRTFEEALRQSEARLRAATELVGLGHHGHEKPDDYGCDKPGSVRGPRRMEVPSTGPVDSARKQSNNNLDHAKERYSEANKDGHHHSDWETHLGISTATHPFPPTPKYPLSTQSRRGSNRPIPAIRVDFLFDADTMNSMRYGANLAAVGVNVPIAIIFALTARPGRTLPTAVCVLIVVGLMGLAAWKFPRAEKRSSFEWFTFLSVFGSALLWTGVFLVAIKGDSLPSVAYTGLDVLIFGGIGLILFAVFGSYISIRKERGF